MAMVSHQKLSSDTNIHFMKDLFYFVSSWRILHGSTYIWRTGSDSRACLFSRWYMDGCRAFLLAWNDWLLFKDWSNKWAITHCHDSTMNIDIFVHNRLFSRKTRLEPLDDKSWLEVAGALRTKFKRCGFSPKCPQADLGETFYGQNA